MKKLFYSFAVVALLGASSCSKETSTLNTLHGTWRLESSLDDTGILEVNTGNCTYEELITFFTCAAKDQSDCGGTTKTTSVCTVLGATTTTINGGTFSYSVFDKKQLVLAGTYYEIESISSKELKFHNVRTPKATQTYSKQK